MHFFLHRAVLHQLRRRRLGLRLLPAVLDLGDLAAQAERIDFRRTGIDADRHAALQALAACIGDVFEQEAGTLLFLQAAKLPAHQRHQLRVLVDRNGDAPQQFLLVELLQMRAQILQVGLHLGAVVHFTSCRFVLLSCAVPAICSLSSWGGWRAKRGVSRRTVSLFVGNPSPHPLPMDEEGAAPSSWRPFSPHLPAGLRSFAARSPVLWYSPFTAHSASSRSRSDQSPNS